MLILIGVSIIGTVVYKKMVTSNKQNEVLESFENQLKEDNTNNENKNSILLSNYLTIDDYAISYTVDDMGNYFYIETTIEKENKKYLFHVELNKEKNIIQKIEEIN